MLTFDQHTPGRRHQTYSFSARLEHEALVDEQRLKRVAHHQANKHPHRKRDEKTRQKLPVIGFAVI